MRIVLAISAFFLFAVEAFADDYCQGCGCKGGPGYRAPNGQCIGWKRLHKVCGTPPTTRCTAEGPALLANRKLGIASTGDEAARTPVTSNQHRTLEDGIGCVRTTNLQIWRYCSGEESTCESARQTLLDGKTCITIPTDTTVTIEASSRSLDWLRIRVPGVASPVWTERTLVLGGQ